MEQVLQQFCLDGTPVSCEPFGNGHINRTFRVTCSSGRVYTLQRINRVAFRHPEELIENIDAVSRFIAKKNTGLEMIRLCTARDGRKYAVDAQGEFWRAYDYISGGLSLEAPRDCNDFYQAAVAFGKFQQALADFPAATLHETIPRFHDTEDRLCQLRASVEADACGRVREAGPELAFISAREQELGTLCRMLRSGALPLRVTHNDTKLNNVLLDEKRALQEACSISIPSCPGFRPMTLATLCASARPRLRRMRRIFRRSSCVLIFTGHFWRAILTPAGTH